MTAISAAQISAPANTAALVRNGTANAQSDRPTATAKPVPTVGVSATSISLSASATAATAAASGAVEDRPAGRKDFATVAKDARASLDAGYQKIGKTTGDIRTTFNEWKTAFGELDRRSLYAIASNEGDHFSDVERSAAQSIMDDQVNTAMGFDNPANAAHPTAAMSRSEVRFLDGVSDEEKASLGWAKRRAAAQFSYESLSSQEGQTPEKLDSDNPLVKLIKGGLDRLKQMDDPSQKLEDTPQYKQAIQLAERMKAAADQKNSDGASASATASPKVDLTV